MKLIKNIFTASRFLVHFLGVFLAFLVPKEQMLLTIIVTTQIGGLMWLIINRTNVILDLQIKILDKLEELKKRI